MSDWFKFYENDLDEMRLQWAIHEMPEVLPVWIVLLSEACRHKDGTLSGYHEDFELFGISKRINISVPLVNQGIGLLLKIKYIERLPCGGLKIRKWDEKQSEYCQKKTRLQNQSGDENTNSKVNRTKKEDIVRIVSGHTPESVGQEEKRRDRGEEKEEIGQVLIPEKLMSNLNFNDTWQKWMVFRRTKKACKNWNALWNNQLALMSEWGPEYAIQSMKASMANDWQGIFPPKANNNFKAKKDACI